MEKENFFDLIVKWNKERLLLNSSFNQQKEIAFIIEEILESTGKYNSENARPISLMYSQKIITENNKNPEEIVDALADIIVYATGGIAKLGYNPKLIMEEVYQEINSRTGKVIDGKFVKEENASKYKADFSKCYFKN